LQSRDSFFSDLSFNLLSKDISVPKKYLNTSNSSAEEEDATHEQRTNHQLRYRIRHLENDLRDITAPCCAERECRMNLEAVIGGEILIPI
jgi:hypothetical protein